MKKIQRIIVPLDGSKNSLRALDVASTIATNSGAAVTGFHVVKFPIEFSKNIRRRYKKSAEKIMLDASKRIKKSKVSFTPIIRFDGHVGNEVIKYAKARRFDLIVMGSKGPNPIAEMFLGSVANYVLNKSKIPVLLVK